MLGCFDQLTVKIMPDIVDDISIVVTNGVKFIDYNIPESSVTCGTTVAVSDEAYRMFPFPLSFFPLTKRYAFKIT